MLFPAAAGATALRAQDGPSLPMPAAGTATMSRAELETLVHSADSALRDARTYPASLSRLRKEAELGRQRLVRGDLEEGDRLVVTVIGQPALSDTFTVRAEQLLALPGLPELSLHGVLQSEVEERVRQHLARFIRAPEVHVSVLLQLGVLGAVGHPGYYAVPMHLQLSDVLMRAGGPAPNGRLDGMVIERRGEVLWAASALRDALATGATVDRLGLRSGDAVMVPEARRFSFTNAVQLVAALTGVVLAAQALQHR